MDHSWFEMQDLRKRKLDSSVWVSLRSQKSVQNDIAYGKNGYTEDFTGHGTLMISVDQKESAEQLSWSDVGIGHSVGLNFVYEKYSQSDLYEGENVKGIHLVLDQTFDNNYDNHEWHLHQDIVINLGLKREGDVWICPRQGYTEVAKLERNEEGEPINLQIKNQFLKDYLAARNSGLYVTSFFSRDAILETLPHLPWNKDTTQSKNGKDIWEFNILEIHEGGFAFGEKIAISHASRTDVDENDDVPDMTAFPTDENVKSEYYEKSFTGKKLYRLIAELWKYEWINPAATSPITLGHEDNTDFYYIVDVIGNKETGNQLKKGGKWLWFKPELVSHILSIRGSSLRWYTKDTGELSCSPSWGIHFGVNEIGLITVYAKDIGRLPSWQQQIWSAHNIAPEGGIGRELHASQVKAEPANTHAPERFLKRVISELNAASEKQFNTKFFRGHHSIDEIITTINRFRAVDDKGLFSMAKDIARIIVDDIDLESLQKLAVPPKGTKWGSLKTLENLLALKISKEKAREITAPLVGVYELRHGDAHLPSSETNSAFKLIEVDRTLPYVVQGYQILFACVNNLHIVLDIIQNWDDIEVKN